MRKPYAVGILLSAVCCLAPGSVANEVVLEPSKDNTIYVDDDGTLSNGAGDHLHSGVVNVFRPGRRMTDFIRRALLAFDIAGAVPVQATITRVTLTLNMSTTRAGEFEFELYRVLSDWGEEDSAAGSGEGGGGGAQPGDATWLHAFFDTDLWATPGGDFSETASASQSVGGEGFYTWESPQMVADVQAWLGAPATNFGWILLGAEPEEFINTAKRFDSRTNPTPANRPQLTVEWTAPPGNQVPGDCNQDGVLDVSDVVCTLGVLFRGVPPVFPCGDGSPEDPGTITLIDWQPDGTVDISDPISAVHFLFDGDLAHPLAVPGDEVSGCVPILGCPLADDCP